MISGEGASLIAPDDQYPHDSCLVQQRYGKSARGNARAGGLGARHDFGRGVGRLLRNCLAPRIVPLLQLHAKFERIMDRRRLLSTGLWAVATPSQFGFACAQTAAGFAFREGYAS